ncbi:Outer membrane transport energization protein ExbB [Candidatus Nitrosacidococcus tergens]|uniref:Outer membrane transport energization protein ExbB n=2 Tax=Candidatus Nitrosacidococcus tergens TaxID=553981 RepID=A0A7G1QBR1_9GAMM|nr:Outer membrane transport energization protein ExbB [Candidatus Nitrosacidococcus tergens]
MANSKKMIKNSSQILLKKIFFFALNGMFFLPMNSWGETPKTLDQLLNQVRQEGIQEKKLNAARESHFLSDRNRQKELLEKAKSDLVAADQREQELREIFKKNEEILAEKEADLKERSNSLKDLFETAQKVAQNFLPILNESLVSAQFPDRSVPLTAIAEKDKLPTINNLRQLWLSLQEQMTESGKIVTFQAPVITVGGEIINKQVTRVGTFTAVSEGKYLRYLPEPVSSLAELSRQPAARLLGIAADFEKATGDEALPIAVDPSRGTLLSLLVQNPNLKERIAQGGWIGYVTIILGVIGLLVALQRFIYLSIVDRKIEQQRRTETPDQDNPLGRILGVYKNEKEDVETLTLRLDEAILKEIPPIERGLPILAILADVAPLLGLLGTVTGMIETFQAITLFGTNDPKLMSAGISEALVTTVIGLVVAIPILLIHSSLASKSNRIIQILDEESAAIIAWIAEKQHGLQESKHGNVL